jgi:hypothetical protein
MEAIGFAMITRLGEGSFSPPVHVPTSPVRFSSYCCSRSDKDSNLDVVASDGIAFLLRRSDVADSQFHRLKPGVSHVDDDTSV